MRQITASLDKASALSEIARAAGEKIMGIYAQTHISAQSKDDKSPVTQADLMAHETIVAGLAKHFPNVPVVSEEDESSLAHRLPTGSYWLIDPLDGTKEFLTHSDDFTVNIALIQEGVATFGVVYAPALNEMYWGGAGLGAFVQTTGPATPLICKKPTQEPNPWRVVVSKSHLNQETQTFIARLGATTQVQAGSSLKFCQVARGEADIYPRLGPTCEWDTAAAQAVLEGAGGVVLNIEGAPLRYGKPEVLNPWFIAATSTEYSGLRQYHAQN